TGISLLTSTIMKRNFSSTRRLGLPGRETERSSVPLGGSSSLLPVEVLLRVPAQIRFRSDGAGELGPRVRHQEAVICSLLNRRLRSSRSRTEVHLQAIPEPLHHRANQTIYPPPCLPAARHKWGSHRDERSSG